MLQISRACIDRDNRSVHSRCHSRSIPHLHRTRRNSFIGRDERSPITRRSRWSTSKQTYASKLRTRDESKRCKFYEITLDPMRVHLGILFRIFHVIVFFLNPTQNLRPSNIVNLEINKITFLYLINPSRNQCWRMNQWWNKRYYCYW